MHNKREGFSPRRIGAGLAVVGGVIAARYAASRLQRRQSERQRRSHKRSDFMHHPSLRTWHGMAMAVEHDPVSSRPTVAIRDA